MPYPPSDSIFVRLVVVVGEGGGRSNYVGFLPKFGMSVAMGVHNLCILIKLKIAFFIPG